MSLFELWSFVENRECCSEHDDRLSTTDVLMSRAFGQMAALEKKLVFIRWEPRGIMLNSEGPLAIDSSCQFKNPLIESE
jgi:hypothetical protein